MGFFDFLFGRRPGPAPAPEPLPAPAAQPAAYTPAEQAQQLRELLVRQFGPDHKHQYFLGTHADNRFSHSRLGPIYRRLLAADATLTDDMILRAYCATSPFQTNTIAAAELELTSVATICYFRPHLTARLLENGLLALIASYGDELTADNVVAFVQHHLLRDDAEPSGGLPHPQGVAWLTYTVPASKPQIQEVLTRMIARNRQELAD